MGLSDIPYGPIGHFFFRSMWAKWTLHRWLASGRGVATKGPYSYSCSSESRPSSTARTAACMQLVVEPVGRAPHLRQVRIVDEAAPLSEAAVHPAQYASPCSSSFESVEEASIGSTS